MRAEKGIIKKYGSKQISGVTGGFILRITPKKANTAVNEKVNKVFLVVSLNCNLFTRVVYSSFEMLDGGDGGMTDLLFFIFFHSHMILCKQPIITFKEVLCIFLCREHKQAQHYSLQYRYQPFHMWLSFFWLSITCLLDHNIRNAAAVITVILVHDDDLHAQGIFKINACLVGQSFGFHRKLGCQFAI